MGKTRSFLIEAENDDSEASTAALWLQMATFALIDSNNIRHGGSRPGKAGNKQRDYASAHLHYMKKYFWPRMMIRPGTTQRGPEQDEAGFERRFRMSRGVFNRVFTSVTLESDYIRKGLSPDATGRMGISPLLKVVCALRQLAYGIPADLSDDLFDVSETTASLCLEEFCKSTIRCFSSVSLRQPTAEDLIRIEKEFSDVGFPGCIGCLNCAGWQWKNCPKALQGIMKGKDGVPCLRMEVICSLDLWVWGFQFGLPGAMNDLNILEVSNHFQNVLSGVFPPSQPKYIINGKSFDWFYYLTDGIYPQWKVFIKALTEPGTKKGKAFSSLQEGVRKCVERVFGVLFRRFKLLYVGCEFWTSTKMQSVATAAICLHNLIVEDRRANYSSDGANGLSISRNDDHNTSDITFHSVAPLSVMEDNYDTSDDIKVKGLQRSLTAALMEHVWDIHGSSE